MCLFNLLFIIAYFVKFRTSEFTFYLYFLKKSKKITVRTQIGKIYLSTLLLCVKSTVIM